MVSAKDFDDILFQKIALHRKPEKYLRRAECSLSLFPRGFEIPIEAQIRAQKKLLKDSTVIYYANLLAIRFEQLSINLTTMTKLSTRCRNV